MAERQVGVRGGDLAFARRGDGRVRMQGELHLQTLGKLVGRRGKVLILHRDIAEEFVHLGERGAIGGRQRGRALLGYGGGGRVSNHAWNKE